MRHLANLLVLLTLTSTPLLAQTSLSFSAQPGSGIEISADRWLSIVPPVGYLPLRITIHNQTAASGTWRLESTSSGSYNSAGTMSSSTAFPVAGGRTGIFSALLPLSPSPDTTSCEVSLSGPGMTNGSERLSSYTDNALEYFAMSEAMARNSWTPLESKLKGSSSREMRGSKVQLNDAPREWRGYTGLADLWLTEDEWLALEPPVRSAMLDWVASGGRVYLFQNAASPKSPAQLQLPPPREGQLGPGFGQIILTAWNGQQIEVEAATQLLKAPENAWAGLVGSYARSGWKLRTLIGGVKPGTGFVLGCALLFALVAGPLNLFWFAAAGRRHRLFWTTPLITVAFTAVIVIYSIVRDGFGGHGARMIVASVLPGPHEIAIIQEQVSKTGILLRGDFPVAEDYLMIPLTIENRRAASSRQMREVAGVRSGYFASRSVQAQLLKTIRSTRGELEVAWNQGGGTITSSLGFTLDPVFVRNENGDYFKTTALQTGEKKTLHPASFAEYSTWWKAAGQPAGAVLEKALTSAARTADFFAGVSDPGALAIPTLAAIRWSQQSALCTGQITVSKLSQP